MSERDKYDEMRGPELAEELAKRELPVSGKVEELRDRLREDDAKPVNDPPEAPEGSEDAPDPETEGEEVEVPEQREPVDYDAGKVVLTEAQARVLNAGEASLRRHFRYVFGMAERKYGEGDTVVVVMDWANNVARTLPFGIEIPLDVEDTSDGLERLREANDQQNEG